MNVHLIKTDGTEQRVDAPFAKIAELIGAHLLDSVNLQDGRVMLVDDHGYDAEQVELPEKRQTAYGLATVFERRPTRARKPVNAKATQLYHAICRPGTTHQIVGDVAIVVDAEVDA